LSNSNLNLTSSLVEKRSDTSSFHGEIPITCVPFGVISSKLSCELLICLLQGIIISSTSLFTFYFRLNQNQCKYRL